MTTPTAADQPIAVVGLACRLPGADTLDQLWDTVVSGRTTFERVSDDEAAVWGWSAPLRGRPDFVPVRSTMSDIDLFAAEHFGVSPRDAVLMDPQQRVFVETVSAALDDAGIGLPTTLRVGVFSSCTASSYLVGPLADAGLWHSHDLSYSALLGCDKDFLSSRVSYLLGFRGPSVVVQTACSSSLVAVHAARRSLQLGECDVAVVGGASISLPSMGGYLAPAESIFSKDGDCRPFDAASAGTLKANGVAVAVLAPVDQSEPDRVYAVVTGSAVNNDGADRAGYSAPGLSGQVDVVARAHAEAKDAGGGPLRYVEMHGTGTRLGDPIEVLGLNQGLDQVQQPGVRDQPVAIGALKGTMGHLDAAAGIGGLLKACLVVRHGTIPPMPGFTSPNPLLEPGRLTVPTGPGPVSGPLSVAVSSFGMGGTNAHVVLAGEVTAEPSPRPPSRRLVRTRCWPASTAPQAGTGGRGGTVEPSSDGAGAVTGPAPFTVERVLEAVREVFLDPTIDADDDFFEAGADSLAVLGLLSELETAGVRLDFTEIQQAPTARGLAQYLLERYADQPDLAGQPCAAASTSAAAPGPAPATRSVAPGVIPVRLSEGSPQVFLMHPAGGTTVCYVDLARRLEPCGVLGLNFPWASVGRDLSLRDLARTYLAAVRAEQPTGPYWLGGWSFGGNLAAEMVLQLADDGVTDVGLVMVDSHPPHAYINGRCTEEDYLRSFPRLLRQLFPGLRFRSSPDEASSSREILDLVVWPQGAPQAVDQMEKFYAIWVDNHRALKGWLPDRSVRCPTLVVEASEPEDPEVLRRLGIAQTSVHEWERYLTQEPRYAVAPGDHYSVISSPAAVEIIAQAVLGFVQDLA